MAANDKPAALMLADAGATDALGAALATAISAVLTGAERAPGIVLYLTGPLGAGKTSLARALLRGLGHRGRVPSPTYTLVEPYDLGSLRVMHLDLYRLNDAAELHYLGLPAEGDVPTVHLVEWPERGAERMLPPDLIVRLAHAAPAGREAELAPVTITGQRVLVAMPEPWATLGGASRQS